MTATAATDREQTAPRAPRRDVARNQASILAAAREALTELVRVILDELITAAQTALSRTDGTGLEEYLHASGRSFAEHQSYADELMGPARSEGADRLRTLMAELVDQAREHGEVAAHIGLDDVLATAWPVRGVVQTSPDADPDAWQRHLRIHLAGLPAPRVRPGVT